MRPQPIPPAAECRTAAEMALATEILRSFGELRFVALGASMLPSIFPGDVLVVRRQPAGSVRTGDVVLCPREGRFYAHRVVRKIEAGERSYLTTRGDALRKDDPPIPESELLGCVIALVRRGRRIDLVGAQAAASQWLQWAVRYSDGVAAWLLRWHRLRTRIALGSGDAHLAVPTRLAGCM